MKTGKNTDKPKFDLYQTVTDRVIEMMETCKDPCKRPWISSGKQISTPSNALTGNPYRGTNVVLLWLEAHQRKYESGLWASYDQWFRLGGGVKEEGKGKWAKTVKPSMFHVRKGETGTLVTYAKKFDRDPDNPDDKGGFMLRYSNVFNAAQVEGLEGLPDRTTGILRERHAGAEEFLRHTLADFDEGYDTAFYSPTLDHIRMPAPEQFKDTKIGTAMEHYYSVRFHEYTHWTGHKDRCNRNRDGGKWSKDYALEELVAELGSAFLCAHLGITATVREDHARHMKHWVKAMRNDKKAIFTAAAAAQKAVDFMVDKQPKTTDLSQDSHSADEEFNHAA